MGGTVMWLDRLASTTVLLATLALPTQASATTFINGKVDAMARVQLDDVIHFETNGPLTITTVGDAGSSGYGAIINQNDFYTYANVTAGATWNSVNSGSIAIDWSWRSNSGPSGVLATMETNLALPNCSYTFIASDNGAFEGDYSIIGSGDTFGLQPIYGFADSPIGPYGGNFLNPTGAGVFSFALNDGQTYTFAFYNSGNVSSLTGITATASARADINWRIVYDNDVVPEPANWAMLIAGFGLVGAMARRRRLVA